MRGWRRAFSPAELAGGWRLACLARASENLTVDVPPLATRPKAATAGVGRQIILRPAVQKRYVELDEPSLEDQRSDLGRLLDAMDDLELSADLDVVRTLGPTLRASGYRATAVVVDDALIGVEPGDTTAEQYGIAFDLGTTTAVATLLDLTTGTPAATQSMLNKQQPFGGDVISRISATMLDEGALERLRGLAQETLAELARDVCETAGVAPEHVYELALAGNATMVQLALGIDPEPLIREFTERHSVREREVQPENEPPKKKRIPSAVALLVPVAVVVVIAALFFSLSRSKGPQRETPVADIPPIPHTEKEEKVEAPAPLSPAGNDLNPSSPRRHTLRIAATERTWLRVGMDGGRSEEALLNTGQTKEWTTQNGFHLKIGNAGGCVLTLDGKQLEPLGRKGEVVDFKLPREEVPEPSRH